MQCWLITLAALYSLFYTPRSFASTMRENSGAFGDTIRIEHEPARMRFECEVQSHYTIDIEPLATGHLQLLNYTQGEMVRQGQLLLRINPSRYREEVRAAELALSAAQSQRIIAQNQYNRYAHLSDRKARSRKKLNLATQQLAIARAAVNRAKLRLRQANNALLGTEFHAPFSGVIGQTQSTIGERVGRGTELEVVNTLSNIDSILITLTLPTERYIRIAMRDSSRLMLYNDERMFKDITLHLENGTDYPHKGNYKFTLRSTHSGSDGGSGGGGVVILHILFANPHKSLRPGDKVTVSAQTDNLASRAFVPHHCLVERGGSTGVYHISNDGSMRYRAVELGDSYGSRWEVTRGLEHGDRILSGTSIPQPRTQ